jgi:hypothetical protein
LKKRGIVVASHPKVNTVRYEITLKITLLSPSTGRPETQIKTDDTVNRLDRSSRLMLVPEIFERQDFFGGRLFFFLVAAAFLER